MPGDGEVDAAELDRDLIASRLRQDVVSTYLRHSINYHPDKSLIYSIAATCREDTPVHS